MSLNQKYTWKDFLGENPEFKKKGVKRTSSEGKKAFESAYKAKIKEVLKGRLAWLEKEKARVTKKRDALTTEMKASKNIPLRKKLQKKIGRMDSYLSRLSRPAAH